MIVKTSHDNSLESESGLWTADKNVQLKNLKTGLPKTQTNVDEDEVESTKDNSSSSILPADIGTDFTFKRKIAWFNLFGMTLLHAAGLYGLVLAFAGHVNWRTCFYAWALGNASTFAITMGAHRLWSHKSYKAKKWFKVFLLLMTTISGQNCLWVWVRDHRQHHKYSDTDADPHNATRGFFFSHVGWLLSRKHPKVIELGKNIDMSDLNADPWIMFQMKYYFPLYIIFAFTIPTLIPIYCWGEAVSISMWFYATRTILTLNLTWLVNSAAHLYGTRPYDNKIAPVQCKWTMLFSIGENWHNYHHAFPWDYRASELGTPFNPTGYLIDVLADWGVIYDRREATPSMHKNRIAKHGDGTYNEFKPLLNFWSHPFSSIYSLFVTPKTDEDMNGQSVQG